MVIILSFKGVIKRWSGRRGGRGREREGIEEKKRKEKEIGGTPVIYSISY